MRLSVHISQVAHQAGSYPSFCSMKQLGIFLLPPGWDVSPLHGYPQHWIHQYPFIHLGGEATQEQNVLNKNKTLETGLIVPESSALTMRPLCLPISKATGEKLIYALCMLIEWNLNKLVILKKYLECLKLEFCIPSYVFLIGTYILTFMLKSEGIICILMMFWHRIFIQNVWYVVVVGVWLLDLLRVVYNSFLTYHWMSNHSEGACKQANERCSCTPNGMALLWNALYFTLLMWDRAVLSAGNKQIIVSTKITFFLGYLPFDHR